MTLPHTYLPIVKPFLYIGYGLQHCLHGILHKYVVGLPHLDMHALLSNRIAPQVERRRCIHIHQDEEDLYSMSSGYVCPSSVELPRLAA